MEAFASGTIIKLQFHGDPHLFYAKETKHLKRNIEN